MRKKIQFRGILHCRVSALVDDATWDANPETANLMRLAIVLARAALPPLLLVATSIVVLGDEVAPLRMEPSVGTTEAQRAVFSERTLVVGLEIDRGGAGVLSYTLKQRPYLNSLGTDAPRAHEEGATVQLEVVLHGPAGLRHTRQVDGGTLCLLHDGDAEPHIAGDTIRMHRDSLVVELPERAGFDRVEVAYYENDGGSALRRSLGTLRLDRERFAASGGTLGYSDLAFADPHDDGPPPVPRASTALWPEDFDDPDLFQVFGDLSEGDRRINVVIVPDGYTYAEKALMETHANEMVTHFRGKVPYAEHDPFLNYTLVYAYSVDSGTDQCDCGIVLDTAMGTRFPQQTPQCGHSDNRCLYYGGGCDTSGTGNIVAAELRAPYHDETIVMVNTTRYGGCGGSRAVYSAANDSAREVAVHELGHSLGGLADEYSYNPGCGFNAGEINTSLDAIDGAWPEWIEDLGPPKEGAQYYQQCVYRPQTDCEMRSLNQPFCAVCNQHWSLITFGHWRVAPTAPVESQSPEQIVLAWQGVPVDFSVVTRLSTGANVANLLTWKLNSTEALGEVIGTGTTAHTHVFDEAGNYGVSIEVIADANFVKRAKDGPNVGGAVWLVSVRPPPPEISPPGSAEPLRFEGADQLNWEDAASAGALSYNLYRGDVASLESGAYGVCLQPDLEQNETSDSETPPPAVAWFYLVAGENPAGEGPLGESSDGQARSSGTPCD
jgi:hypothetical protein